MRISANEEPNEKDEFLAEVGYPEARLCEDYILINQDLEDAIFYAERVLAKTREIKSKRGENYKFNSENDRRIFEADWVAALIKYYRCFGKGVREKLDPCIFEKLQDAKKAHEYFIDLRSKHIAHSINSFEQAKVYVVLPPVRTSDPKVLDVGGFSTRRFIEVPENIENFLRLANIAKQEAYRLFAESQRQVFEKALKEPIENLYSRPYASIQITGGDKAAKSNRQKPSKKRLGAAHPQGVRSRPA